MFSDDGLASSGESTSSAQDLPEAGRNSCVFPCVPSVEVSGLVTRSASEPPAFESVEAILRDCKRVEMASKWRKSPEAAVKE